MTIKTIHSTKNTLEEILNDLSMQANGSSPSLVVFFASSAFNPPQVAEGMQKLFSDANVIGCTTAGEIVSGAMLKNSITAMLLPHDIVEDVCIKVATDIKTNDAIVDAFLQFEEHFGVSMRSLDIEKYAGLVLFDGLSGAEERVLEKMGDLTDIAFIGGSAGDDLQFKNTTVFAQGKAYTNAAILAVMKLPRGFDIVKTQSFRNLGKTLVATEVDEARRAVLRFNNKPASMAYAEALGVSVEQAANHFMSHPVGLMNGDEPYVRSPQRFDDTTMIFYCNIKEGMELTILESTDIVADTKKIIDQKCSVPGNVAGIINFHCILRTLELEQKKQTDAYGAIFNTVPTIGFSTYGEAYIGHINQTSTMLLLK